MTPDNESDLRWYFTEAAGDCGIRSPLGIQLDMLRQGTLPGKHERRYDPEIAEHVVAAGHRANRIAARLRGLSARDQLVLELQYGATGQLGGEGISVALACWTPAAKTGYASALQRNGKARFAATIRLWLIWLSAQSAREEGPARDVVEAILQQARRAVDGATGRYEAGR